MSHADRLRETAAYPGIGGNLRSALLAGAEALEKSSTRCLFCAFTGDLESLKRHSAACEEHPAVKALKGHGGKQALTAMFSQMAAHADANAQLLQKVQQIDLDLRAAINAAMGGGNG